MLDFCSNGRNADADVCDSPQAAGGDDFHPPFSGVSSHRTDFPAWKVQPLRAKAPKQEHAATTGDFAKVTTHRSDFVRYNNHAKTMPIRPAKAQADEQRGPGEYK